MNKDIIKKKGFSFNETTTQVVYCNTVSVYESFDLLFHFINQFIIYFYAQLKQNNYKDCGIFVIEYFKMTLDLFSKTLPDTDLSSTMESCKETKMKMTTNWCCIRRKMATEYIKYYSYVFEEHS